MEDLRVAFLQIAPTGSVEGNLEKGRTYCRMAKEQGADIALFPEMWSSGYQIPEEIDRLKALAVPRTVILCWHFRLWQKSCRWRSASHIWKLGSHCPGIRSHCLIDTAGKPTHMPRCTPAISERSVGLRQETTSMWPIWIQRRERSGSAV